MGKQNQYPCILKAAFLWLCQLLLCLPTPGQTTNISGIVNTYHRIIEVIPSRACVRVSSVAGLSPSAKVMIVQMKGAIINTTSNNINWGDTTSLNNAGNYEINYICFVRGDSVFLVYDLLNSYTAPAGKVQLVTFGSYQNATVTDTLKAKPWDNATGTGGVIAIDVVDTLRLMSPVFGDGTGFRGGNYVLSDGTCSNVFSATGYYYNGGVTTPQNGAYKGEAVADVLATQSGGRGAPANGGGGGNNHNNSGGGGANLSAGGRGGGNSSSSGCTATLRGEAGRPLRNYGGKKIFLGGGGGAGHNNGGFQPTFGGNGGGILFIHAETLISNGYRISASGKNGGSSLSDGAGGGGAGGTIIMDVLDFVDNATIVANGGNGGGSNDGGNIGRCFGGGGGGSGGALYFTGNSPAGTVTTTGGAAGIETGRSATCNTEQTAFSGNTGQLSINYSCRLANVFASGCGIILPTRLIFFNAELVNGKTHLNWRILDPGLVENFVIERMVTGQKWKVIINAMASGSIENYSTIDPAPLQGENQYRLKIFEKNNSVLYSPTRRVFVNSKDDFTFYPNPALDKITIIGKLVGADFKLLDITGRIILQLPLMSNTITIALPPLSPGIYNIRVGQATRQMVIR